MRNNYIPPLKQLSHNIAHREEGNLKLKNFCMFAILFPQSTRLLYR